MEESMKAMMVTYTGEVQGVGFRATAASIARQYPVSGWVKNLSDGRVRLFAEGPELAVEYFLAAIRAHWERYIVQEEAEEQPPSGEGGPFRVDF
jgi:acylphosphatase